MATTIPILRGPMLRSLGPDSEERGKGRLDRQWDGEKTLVVIYCSYLLFVYILEREKQSGAGRQRKPKVYHPIRFHPSQWRRYEKSYYLV